MVLTFGIIGLVGSFLCAQIPLSFFAIAAWIMGQNDLREIKAGRMDPEGEGQTRAGWILGIIGSILLVLTIAGCMLWFLMIGLR